MTGAPAVPTIYPMQTSQEWWTKTKADPQRLTAWLLRQYTGEVTAAGRIRNLAKLLPAEATSPTGPFPAAFRARTLYLIAEQEAVHAEWVMGLLLARGIVPQAVRAEERYWAATMPKVDTFEHGAAVGAHAEAMRLERIRTIANDPEAPADIRAVFLRILPEEEFHERAFREMAGDAAMVEMKGAHELGMSLLGLSP